MKFNTFLKSKEYIIYAVMKLLNIVDKAEEYYSIGVLALFKAIIDYNFAVDYLDQYITDIIYSYMSNEIVSENKYVKILTFMDLYKKQNSKIEDFLIDENDPDFLGLNLTPTDYCILKLKRMGFEDYKIAELLNQTTDKVVSTLSEILTTIKCNILKLDIH